MEKLIITIEDTSILGSLKKILSAIKGITVVSVKESKKCGLDEALEDIDNSRVTSFENSDELFSHLGI